MYKVNVRHNEKISKFIIAMIDQNYETVKNVRNRKNSNAVTEVNKVYMTKLLEMECSK